MNDKQEFIEVMRLAFKKAHNWHDYQDHCHNCGESDVKKYPYCVPYAAAEKSGKLNTIPTMEAYLEERVRRIAKDFKS